MTIERDPQDSFCTNKTQLEWAFLGGSPSGSLRHGAYEMCEKSDRELGQKYADRSGSCPFLHLTIPKSRCTI